MGPSAMSLPSIQIHFAPDNDTNAEDVTISGITITPEKHHHIPLTFNLNSPPATTHSFTEQPTPETQEDPEPFRLTHLVPPPNVISPRLTMPAMTRAGPPVDKKGIDESRFQELLKSARERRASMAPFPKKEPVELRKQVTMKAHKSKALERRAIFMSKVEQLPCVAAARTPVTPPDSPAVFHFSLPSPGLQSPLALFESLSIEEKKQQRSANLSAGNTTRSKRETWVEEVDFKAKIRRCTEMRAGERRSKSFDGTLTANALKDNVAITRALPPAPQIERVPARQYDARDFTRQPNINVTASTRHKAVIPSLAQISAHLASNKAIAHQATPPALVADETDSDSSDDSGYSISYARMRAHQRTPSPPSICITPPPPPAAEPVHVPAVKAPRAPIPLPSFLKVQRRSTAPVEAPPIVIVAPAPITPPASKSGMTAFPRSSAPSPPRVLPAPTASPVRRRCDTGLVLPALARPASSTRFLPSQHLNLEPASISSSTSFLKVDPMAESRTEKGRAMVERLRRRSSSPAELPKRKEGGVLEHPVLAMKGGF